MFRFSASSSRQANIEEIEDVLKNWGKLALAGIFLTSSLLLPHANAEAVQYRQVPAVTQAFDLSILGNLGSQGRLGNGILGNLGALPPGIQNSIRNAIGIPSVGN